MNDFFALVFHEFKRFTHKRNILIWGIIIIFVALITFKNNDKYLLIPQKIQKFKKIQEKIFKRIPDYKSYSIEGINFFFAPSTLTILCRNSIISHELISNINTLLSIDIKNNLKGEAIESENLFLKIDFSMLILLVMSMMALYHGWESLQNKEYLKFLSSHRNCLKMFTVMVMARFTLLAAVFLVSFGVSLAAMTLDGVLLTTEDWTALAGFLSVSLVMILYFFQLGVLISVAGSGKKAGKKIFAAWFLSIFIITSLVHSFGPGKPPDINDNFQTILDKFETIIKFEKEAEKKFGKFNPNDIIKARKVIEHNWQHIFPQILSLEKQLKNKITSYINRYKRTAILTPVTFYLYTGNEASSRGYENYLQLYGYLLEMRKKFVRFWIDRVYYHDPGILVSFIQGNENIFKGRSCLPDNLWTGLGINLAYCLILFVVSYFLFKRGFYYLSRKDIEELKRITTDLPAGNLKILKVSGGQLNQYLFNILSGKKKSFPDGASVKDDLENLIPDRLQPGKKKIDFLYLCRYEFIPVELRVRDFISFYLKWEQIPGKKRDSLFNREKIKPILNKTFNELKNHETFAVLLSLLQIKERTVYLINDITREMVPDCNIELKHHMEELAQKGSYIIFMTSTDLVDAYGNKISQCAEDGSGWLEMVEVQRRKQLKTG